MLFFYRAAFKQTLMEPTDPKRPSQLTQLYFPGTHAGVGGGSEFEKPLSDGALRFLTEEMARRNLGLELNMDLIPTGSRDVPPPKENGGIDRTFGDYIREIFSLEQCYVPHVVERYRLQPTWRPAALRKFDKELSELHASSGPKDTSLP
jgi:Uncharacterized alpha/beta hydrolase domain (DUF2235)